MSRLFHLILIISLLVTQSTMVIYGPEFDTDSQGKIKSHTEQPLADSAHNCDHFCHASAHLVGFVANHELWLAKYSTPHQAVLSAHATSLTYQPPIPPPIS